MRKINCKGCPLGERGCALGSQTTWVSNSGKTSMSSDDCKLMFISTIESGDKIKDFVPKRVKRINYKEEIKQNA